MNLILPKVYLNKYNVDELSSQIRTSPSFSHSTMYMNAIKLIDSYIGSFVNTPSKRVVLISKPTFTFTSATITVHFFYYLPTISELSISSLNGLSECLSQLFNKKVHLKLTRIHYPYINSHILAQYLVHNAPNNTFIHFQDAILAYPSLNKSELVAHVSGIKIEVSGRLVTERAIPRKTKKASLLGNFKKGNNTMIDYSKFTSKNELGTFTIKV